MSYTEKRLWNQDGKTTMAKFENHPALSYNFSMGTRVNTQNVQGNFGLDIMS